MKKTSNSLLTQIDNLQMEKLLVEVRETLAIGLMNPTKGNKNFTAADLWSIQRQGRTRVTRRFF
ncbi:MAG: hypothetical protein IPP72_06575 [Chitinophagaceae bacterium]|nr:hypothetical protein [Chitinophagaceae bacterium]